MRVQGRVYMKQLCLKSSAIYTIKRNLYRCMRHHTRGVGCRNGKFKPEYVGVCEGEQGR